MSMSFGQALDLSDIAPPSFEPIPAGNYLAVCTEFEVSDKERGKFANCKFEIVAGKYAGRMVWQNITVFHESEKAQGFGQAMLAQWAESLGIDKTQLSGGEQLINKPVGVKLKISPAREYNGRTYDARNEINGFVPSDRVTEDAAPAPAPKPAAKPALKAVPASEPAAEAPAAEGKKSMPWNKK